VAVDAEHLYWDNYSGGSGTTIGRADLDGTGIDESFISGADGPVGVAVDAQHIYWANSNNGTIGRANLDGTDVDQGFITGVGFPEGVAVDAQHIYWASANGTIGRANLDGTGIDESFITTPDGVDLPFRTSRSSFLPPPFGGLSGLE
jgi:sugar lactone lactonase YvrE